MIVATTKHHTYMNRCTKHIVLSRRHRWQKATSQLRSQTLQLLERTSACATKWISIIHQSTADTDNSKIPEYTQSNSKNTIISVSWKRPLGSAVQSAQLLDKNCQPNQTFTPVPITNDTKLNPATARLTGTAATIRQRSKYWTVIIKRRVQSNLARGSIAVSSLVAVNAFVCYILWDGTFAGGTDMCTCTKVPLPVGDLHHI